MKLILLTITIFLASCYALPGHRSVYTVSNGAKQCKLEIKYISQNENGECTYWIKGMPGSRIHGRLRIVDTIGRYHCGDTLMLTLPK